ncbi:MAG: ydeM [Verrucomicrobiaceae bacterium]|nr:ydeM [Verrucomicrobiaceae bacterium]
MTKYYEDYPVGTVIDLGEYTISEEEILEFARKYDPIWFHTDPERAKGSIYGGLIAAGWHTGALMVNRVSGYFDKTQSRNLGSPGMDELRWPNPVRPGDTLHFELSIVGARPSASKPDRGVIELGYLVTRQTGEPVLTARVVVFFARKPA